MRRVVWRSAVAGTRLSSVYVSQCSAARTRALPGGALLGGVGGLGGVAGGRGWASTSTDGRREERRDGDGGDAVGSSVDAAETAKFARVADHWWDVEKGPFAPLHTMSPVRCSFIRAAACAHFELDAGAVEPFTGLRMLDVGCGGGLLCEPMARLGGQVLGVDAVAHSVRVAAAHAARDASVASRVNYRAATAEALVEEGHTFDVVLCLEVIEHVADAERFVSSLAALVRPGGMLVLSTLNRTPTSYMLAVVAAEHVLRWVPRGTHEWSKFVTPAEMRRYTTQSGMHMQKLTGMVFNPLTYTRWTLDEGDTSMNYIAYAIKPAGAAPLPPTDSTPGC